MGVFTSCKMVTLLSRKEWSFFLKCLYTGMFLLLSSAALCPAIRDRRGLAVCPTYLFLVLHFVHSIRYTTPMELQSVPLGVLYGFPSIENTTSLQDIRLQHLHSGCLQGVECCEKEGVNRILIVSEEELGLSLFASLALTMTFATVCPFL